MCRHLALAQALEGRRSDSEKKTRKPSNFRILSPQVTVENGRAVGVTLKGGKQIIAKVAVVSNASVWDTQRLLPAGALPASYTRDALATPECDSFLHLHLGIDATGLPADLDCHHVVVNDWDVGVAAAQVNPLPHLTRISSYSWWLRIGHRWWFLIA
jgi:hypothetical protein